MSNIYLKVTIDENCRSQNFNFLRLKNFLGTHVDIIELQKFLLQLKNQRTGSKTVCDFSIILILKGIMMF